MESELIFFVNNISLKYFNRYSLNKVGTLPNRNDEDALWSSISHVSQTFQRNDASRFRILRAEHFYSLTSFFAINTIIKLKYKKYLYNECLVKVFRNISSIFYSNLFIVLYVQMLLFRLLDNNVLTCIDEASIRELKDLEIL